MKIYKIQIHNKISDGLTSFLLPMARYLVLTMINYIESPLILYEYWIKGKSRCIAAVEKGKEVEM